MSDDTKLTPEQIEVLTARHHKAKEGLERVLATIDRLPEADGMTIADAAVRIIRIALRAQHLGPLAMALASAQLTLDLSPLPGEEEKPEPPCILLPDQKIIH